MVVPPATLIPFTSAPVLFDATVKSYIKFLSTALAVLPLNWMPVTTQASVALVLLKLKIVFCPIIWLAEELEEDMPITDALVVVPMPPEDVKSRMVFELIVAAAALVLMPITCAVVEAIVNCNRAIEFDATDHVTDVLVHPRMP